MAARSTDASRRRRWLARNRPLVILGVVILAIILVASVVPQLIIAGLRQIPKDEEFSYSTTASDAQVVDLAAFEAGEVPAANAARAECGDEEPDFSCFVVDGQAQLSRQTESAATETREEVAVTSTSVLSVAGEPVLSMEDFVRLQSHSAFPVPDPNSSMTVSLGASGDGAASVSTDEFSRNGLQYFFPFNTERISYDFFDPLSQTPEPLDFVDRVEHNGLRSYEFQQTIPAVDLMAAMAQGFTQPQGISDAPEMEPLARLGELDDQQRQAITSLRVNGASSQFYTDAELTERGLSATDRVSLSPFYSVDRTLWVEPDSGAVVDRVEDVVIYLAADQADADRVAEDLLGTVGASDAAGAADIDAAERVLLSTRLAWDGDTQESAQAEAQSTVNLLKALEVIALIGNTVVVFLVAGGLLWWLRRRYREKQAAGIIVEGPGVGGPEDESVTAGDDAAGGTAVSGRAAGGERKSTEG